MAILYSFSETRCEKILEQSNVNNMYIIDKNTFLNDIKNILSYNEKYIIGFGDYSGVDKHNIRIETVCKNQFRNDNITIKKPKTHNFKISDFLKVNENSKLTTAMGNSYCNYSCYLSCNYICKNNLKTKVGFLHIPVTVSIEKVNNYIINYINKLV